MNGILLTLLWAGHFTICCPFPWLTCTVLSSLVRAVSSYQCLWVKEFSVISKVLMRAATISWMTSLSWNLSLFLTLASEQEFVCWFLDYWLHRWIWCWLLRSPGPMSITAAERQHPHLRINHFCAQKESDDCPTFLFMLCKILLVHPFFCPRCPPWCFLLLFVHSLMRTDPIHTSTHIISSALPSFQGQRTKGTLWSQCQKSSVRRSHFQVTRLNTINSLFVFSTCSISVFCFLQKDLIPIISSSDVHLGQHFPPLWKDCCAVVKSFVVSFIPGAVFEFHVIVCAPVDLGRVGRVSLLMAWCVFSLYSQKLMSVFYGKWFSSQHSFHHNLLSIG